jgi:hypothetical protein
MPVTGSAVPRNTANAGCLLPMGVPFTLAGVVFGLAAVLWFQGEVEERRRRVSEE